jgi:hypothetical protein
LKANEAFKSDRKFRINFDNHVKRSLAKPDAGVCISGNK